MNFKEENTDFAELTQWKTPNPITDAKYIDGSVLGQAKYYRIEENKELIEIINFILENESSIEAILALCDVMDGIMAPDPCELTTIPGLVIQIILNIIQTENLDIEIKRRMYRLLVILSSVELIQESQFCTEFFAKTLLNCFNTQNGECFSSITNIFNNLLADKTIGVPFAEILFNNDFLSYFYNIFRSNIEGNSITNDSIHILSQFTQIAMVQIRNLEVDQHTEHMLIMYKDILGFLYRYFEKTDEETQNEICSIIINLCSIANLAELVKHSQFPEQFVQNFPAIPVNQYYPGVIKLFCTFCDLHDGMDDYYKGDFDLIMKRLRRYISDFDFDVKEVMNYIEMCLEEQKYHHIDRIGIFEIIVDKIPEYTSDERLLVCITLMKAIPEALSSNDRQDWLKKLIYFIFDTLDSFSEEQIETILMGINNWICDDSDFIISIGHECDLLATLETLIEDYEPDTLVYARAMVLLENEYFAN